LINDISWGKIKLPEYEKVLIEDWESAIITVTKENWEYHTKNDIEEAFEINIILEKLR